MSAGPRMTLEAAQAAAQALAERWCMDLTECLIVGSIRRRKAHVGDIEFTAPLPQPCGADALFLRISASVSPGPLFVDARPLGSAAQGLAPHFKCCELLINAAAIPGLRRDISVQIHRWTAENRGWIETMRTGPADLGVRFLQAWKRRWEIPPEQQASRNGHLVDFRGAVVPVRTERRCWELCGLPWIDPENRDDWLASAAHGARP